MPKLLFSLLALAILTTGCGSRYLFAGGRPQLATAQHPAKGGVGQVPILMYENNRVEQQRGLPPGSLAQDAQIVQADPQNLCIAVTLRGLDRRYPDLRNWTVVFRSQAGQAEPVEDQSPNIELVPVQTQVYDGLVPQDVQVGTENVCTEVDQYNNCRRWSQRAVYATQWVPGPVEVATGGGQICFANTQHLTLDTTAVALRLNAGRNSGGAPAGPTRLTYQWDFTGTTSQSVASTSGGSQPQQQQQQTSGGSQPVMAPAGSTQQQQTTTTTTGGTQVAQ